MDDYRNQGTGSAGISGRCHYRHLAQKPGDSVARDEVLVDIETDKVVLEVPAPQAGVLGRFCKGKGQPCCPVN